MSRYLPIQQQAPMAPGFWSGLNNLLTGKEGSDEDAASLIPSDAVIEARQSMFKARLPEDLTHYDICLTNYEDAATYDQIKTKKEWTLKFHREFIEAYTQEVEKRGGTVKQYIIKLEPYRKWLDWNGLTNTEANQKKYVNWLHQKSQEGVK